MSQDAPDNLIPQEAKPKPPNSWLTVGAGMAVCAVAAVLLGIVALQYLKTRPLNLRNRTLELTGQVDQLFRDSLVVPENIRRADPQLLENEKASWFYSEFDIDLDSQDPDGLKTLLEREMDRQNVEVNPGEASNTRRRYDLLIGGCKFAEVRLNIPEPPEPPEPAEITADDPALLNFQALAGLNAPPGLSRPPKFGPPLKPVAVIILDDGGYGGEVTEAALALDPRLTLAILPGAPHAAETAKRAVQAGFQVLLHLPMESPQDPGWIAISTPREDMRSLLDEALDRVPGAVGINNHMGSTFCKDFDALTRFFSLLKTRPHFFIDSRTTHETLIPLAAREAGVPVAERKVFLDNDDDPQLIRKQFETLVQFARENGCAVAIGHFRPATVNLLKDLLPELDKRGINLVHASEVVE